jgi:hypothetical protein
MSRPGLRKTWSRAGGASKLTLIHYWSGDVPTARHSLAKYRHRSDHLSTRVCKKFRALLLEKSGRFRHSPLLSPSYSPCSSLL